MKKFLTTALFFGVVLLSSCKIGGNFIQQKYTNLKQIKPVYETVDHVDETDQFSEQDSPSVSNSPDSGEDANGSSDFSTEAYTQQVKDELEGVQQYKIDKLTGDKKLNRGSSEVTHRAKKRIDPKDNDKPDWKKARNNGFWFLGLSGLLVGLGLGLTILLWTEIIMWIFAGLALTALVFAFFYWVRAIKQKHGGVLRNKNYQIMAIILFPSAFGLAFLGVYIAFLTFQVWLFVFMLLAAGAFIASILLLIHAYKEKAEG